MKRYEVLLKLLDSLKDDFEKFYDKGNKAAGTRIRKGMKDLRDEAQKIRLEVQDIKNASADTAAKKPAAAAKKPAAAKPAAAKKK